MIPNRAKAKHIKPKNTASAHNFPAALDTALDSCEMIATLAALLEAVGESGEVEGSVINRVGFAIGQEAQKIYEAIS